MNEKNNMSNKNAFTLPRSSLALGLIIVSCGMNACVADEPGITTSHAGTKSSSGGDEMQPAAGGDGQQTAGTSNGGTSGPVAGNAGTAGSAGNGPQTGGSESTGGQPAAAGAPPAEGGMPAAAGGADDQGGAGGVEEPPVAMSCIFHTVAPPPPIEEAGGAGGAAPAPGPSVVSQPSPFVGLYLTDAAGRTLYTNGGDTPGDCHTAPAEHCDADCAVTWPPFDAGSRILGAGLDDSRFGSIQRGDGITQATYMGWPLYYYNKDLLLGQLTGQGKGKVWHAAKVTPPDVVIMKLGTAKYLADGAGFTLYVSAADLAGTSSADPVSNCDSECSKTFVPFHEKSLSAVTSLEPADFSVFVRKGVGGLQVAYKGMPLYRAATDVGPGTQTGTTVMGITAAAP
jgi:predicted lipoprotein with Yx(FWY)xxD motif